MLHVFNLEEIRGMIFVIPELVHLQDQRAPDFFDKVKAWLADVENALRKNNLAAAGNVAALRSSLISAERGAIPAPVGLQGQSSRRKIQDAAAAYALQQASDIVCGSIQKDQQRIDEAERIAQQMVSMAKHKDIFQDCLTGENAAVAMPAMWRAMSADPELSAGIVSVESLVGQHDALIIFGRTVERELPAAADENK